MTACQEDHREDSILHMRDLVQSVMLYVVISVAVGVGCRTQHTRSHFRKSLMVMPLSVRHEW